MREISENDLIALAQEHGKWERPDEYNGFFAAAYSQEFSIEIGDRAERFLNWVMTLDKHGNYDNLIKCESEEEAVLLFNRLCR